MPRLLRRSQLITGESILSYLYRLANLNYCSLSSLLGLVDDLNSHAIQSGRVLTYPKGIAVLERLGDICDVEPDKLLLASNFRFVEVFSSMPRGIIRVKSKRQFNINKSLRQIKVHLLSEKNARFCPLCLSTSVYHRLSWIPRYLWVCWEHQCLLMDCCPKCKKNISIKEIIDCHCNACKSDLRNYEALFVGDDEEGIRSQKYLARLLGLNELLPTDEFARPPNIPPVVAYELIDRLSRFVLDKNGLLESFPSPIFDLVNEHSQRRDVKFDPRLFLGVRAASLPMLDWPTSFYSFLDACFDQKFFRYLSGQEWFRKYFKGIEHRVIIREFINYFLDRHIVIPTFIATIVKDEKWFYRQIGAVSTKNTLMILKPSAIDPDRLGLVHHNDFFDKEILFNDGTRSFGRTGYFDRLGIESLKCKLDDEWDLKMAGCWLGIGEKSVISLVHKGELTGRLIEEENGNIIEGFIDRKSIESFGRRVIDDFNIEDLISRVSRDYAVAFRSFVDDFETIGVSILSLLKCKEKDVLPFCFRKGLYGIELCLPASLIDDLLEILLLERGWNGNLNSFTKENIVSIEQIWRWAGNRQIESIPIYRGYYAFSLRELEELYAMNRNKLLNRPAPLDDESLDSYLYRVGKQNYYNNILRWTYAAQILPRETRLNFILDQNHLNRIAQFTGISKDRIQKMTVHHYSPKMSKLDYWDESGRNLFISKATTERMCPLCYAQKNATLLPWLFRPVTACPVHHILLENVCAECGEKLTGKKACGSCKKPVAEMKFKRIDQNPIEAKYVALIWKILKDETEYFSGIDHNYPFSVINAPDFFSLLLMLGKLLLEYDIDNPRFSFPLYEVLNGKSTKRVLRGLNVFEYHQVMSAVFELLLEWPVNWHITLGRILESEKTRRAAGSDALWKRKTFPYNLKKALERNPRLSWLWVSFQDYVQENKGKLSELKYWTRYLVEEKDNKESLNISIDLFKLDTRETRLEENAKVLSFEDAAGYLGVSRGNFHDLIKRGLATPVEKTKPNARVKWKFLQSHLDDVTEYLVGRLDARDFNYEEAEVVWLDKAVSIVNYSGVRWVDILEAIHHQRIPAYRQPGIHGLRAVWMTHASLKSLISLFHPKDKLVSIYSVMKIINCGVQTLVTLAAARLLVPEKGYPGRDMKKWRYAHKELTRFKSDYVTIEEASEIVGFKPRTLLNWVERGWLHAVSGPSIDGGYRYRFERKNIFQWRYDRLLSKELRDILGISQRTMEVWLARKKIFPMENMPKNPYWFDRKVAEKILEERSEKKA
jgi:hypothetical protein